MVNCQLHFSFSQNGNFRRFASLLVISSKNFGKLVTWNAKRKNRKHTHTQNNRTNRIEYKSIEKEHRNTFIFRYFLFDFRFPITWHETIVADCCCRAIQVNNLYAMKCFWLLAVTKNSNGNFFDHFFDELPFDPLFVFFFFCIGHSEQK